MSNFSQVKSSTFIVFDSTNSSTEARLENFCATPQISKAALIHLSHSFDSVSTLSITSRTITEVGCSVDFQMIRFGKLERYLGSNSQLFWLLSCSIHLPEHQLDLDAKPL